MRAGPVEVGHESRRAAVRVALEQLDDRRRAFDFSWHVVGSVRPMKLLYKPFGTLAGVLGGLMAGAIFKQIWKLVAHEDDAPDAKDEKRGWTEVIVAAALQGAVFGGVKAAVDRAGAVGYASLTGVWPGDTEAPEKR